MVGWGAGFEIGPARLLRYPEDAGGFVFVGIFRVSALLALRFELSVLRLEGIGDVLEENQAKDDVLVLRRVHIVAETVSHLPQFGFEAEIGTSLCLRFRLSFRRH